MLAVFSMARQEKEQKQIKHAPCKNHVVAGVTALSLEGGNGEERIRVPPLTHPATYTTAN